MQCYSERRARALEAFSGGVAIIPAARTLLRNGDSPYPFRQDSDFHYLTGFGEPDAVLVLAPGHDSERNVLFLRKRDRAQEIWDGERLGVERAVERLGVDAAYPVDELAQRLPDYIAGATTLHYAFGNDGAIDRVVREALETARARARRRGRAPQAFAEPSLVLDPMRAIKSEFEVGVLRQAAAITHAGHLAAMRHTRAGMFEYEIQAIIESEYRRGGAQSTSYESIVASGDRATVLHYVANRDRLEPGALLLVDSGCELDCYATDVTRTWPVDGRFTPEQRAIYAIVLAAQEAAIACVRPNVARNEFHDAAVRTITEGLIDLGLLHGSVAENIERERYRDYYMHGTGHWMGLDVHDSGAYRGDDDAPIRFAPGMVTTVEPGIYVHRDLECDERFKGIGVRIEDDILVTRDGHENLTATIPKRVDDLEAIVGSAARAPATA
ncbi:MAG: aminopeptidase P N-terminal domain-containing protein [Candidatus Eremiobacteraeota bacterium]|nr:aminopeptidase P N-terminal domain-containing protein [Candidatus Eremiobacteraeota bacterium]MBV8373269.1 aminopeptidase P N-terminal domain-containing protein [Candidatus Eremiobacteraeota bacterium]